MAINPSIERTADGSDTLRHPVTGDTYHSLRGALGESLHVFIDNGLATVDKSTLSILEVGFGSGLNAWLTLEYAGGRGMTVEYTGVELYPVTIETARKLNYTDDPLFMALHESPWEEPSPIIPCFMLTKTGMDFAAMEFNRTFDIVYFDAFSPDTQPELWTANVFSKLYGAINPGGILVTYSAKGSVKRALREAGFEVERLPGALGKRHMLRATKKF